MTSGCQHVRKIQNMSDYLPKLNTLHILANSALSNKLLASHVVHETNISSHLQISIHNSNVDIDKFNTL